MSITLKLYGHSIGVAGVRGDTGSSEEEILNEKYAEGIFKVKVDAAYDLSESRDLEAKPIEHNDLPDDQIVEVTLANGERLLTRLDEFKKDIGQAGKAQLELDNAVLPLSADETRGLVKWALKGIKLLGFEWDSALTEPTVQKIAEIVENRLSATPGVYYCDFSNDFDLVEESRYPIKSISVGTPVLILLHGTASSTESSFKGLWNDEHRDIWRRFIEKNYNNKVYALEHRTLSLNPIENACQILEKLNVGQTLHFISHSRGGLVGELLCLGGVDAALKPIESDDISRYVDGLKSRNKKNAEALMERFGELLAKKRPQVERFVRVACPARGTGLVGDRLDYYLSGFLNALEKIPGLKYSDIFYTVRTLALAFAKQRTKPSELPGLQAMVPGSGLIRLLNGTRPVTADLTVIAGDAEKDSLLQGVLVRMLDNFYQGENDFVVETASMLQGVPRKKSGRYSFHQGGKVNHFSYFTQSSFDRVLAGLALTDDDIRFSPISETIEFSAPLLSRGLPQQIDRPLLFMLPGLQGSKLAQGADEIWLSQQQIIAGKLSLLDIDSDTIATGWLDDYYQKLAGFLGASHHVIPFVYDWRKSIAEASKKLEEEVIKCLSLADAEQQPVRFLAHSTGGLVVLHLILSNPTLWKKICRQVGARVVMLGTPYRGSYSIIRLLTRRARITGFLATLDSSRPHRDLLEQISRYPGIIELLPRDRDANYFDIKTWKTLNADDNLDWPIVDRKLLDAASELTSGLENTPEHNDRIIYVAGQSGRTPAGIDQKATDDNRSLSFTMTQEGDGMVPWSNGIPAWARCFYVPAVAHGDLPRSDEHFPVYDELLNRGVTKELSSKPPLLIEGPLERSISSADSSIFFPSENEVHAAAMGAAVRPLVDKRDDIESKSLVRILHGDLRNAYSSVMVGHYRGDTIVSAERVLDNWLDNRMSEFLSQGVYPNQLNSVEIFLHPEKSNRGAVVVGLGRVGELNAVTLRQTLTYALVRYGIAWSDYSRIRIDVPNGPKITSLLIGTSAGGVKISDAVSALLKALVDANRKLASLKTRVRHLSNPATKALIIKPIQQLDIIELYEDVAISAAMALQSHKREYGKELVINSQLLQLQGKNRRATFSEDPAWWRRIQVLENDDGSLEFTPLTDRAGLPSRTQGTQMQLINQLLQNATQSSVNKKQIDAALFELLIPVELKEQVNYQQNLVLLVDKGAARFPWELLHDRYSDESAPIATRIGMIRQLKTESYQSVRPYADTFNALVVGDPISSFPELPAAQKEAVLVHQIVKAGGFDATSLLVRQSGLEIISQLLTNDYRIVHLAGHGVYQYKINLSDSDSNQGETLMTGMVLGDKTFLTPNEINSMRKIPELVFLNCCYLGFTEKGYESVRQNRHQLAANLSTQFIENGVKAVIAAGWAVDDAAAGLFAKTFYEALLMEKTSFGEAVRIARKKTYDAYPKSTTWGAYQCYGDPDYRIHGQGRKTSSRKSSSTFYSDYQALLWIEKITARADNASESEIKAMSLQLEAAIEQLICGEWLEDGGFCESIAKAFAAFGNFEKSIEYYQQSQTAPKGSCTVAALEQLANLRIRNTTALFESDQLGVEEASKVINNNIARLVQMYAIQPAKNCSEFLGSAYKHRALILLPDNKYDPIDDVIDDIKKAIYYYGQSDDSYCQTNYLMLCILLRRLGDRSRQIEEDDVIQIPTKSAVDDRLAILKENLQDNAETRSFWDSIALFDVELVTLLNKDGSFSDMNDHNRAISDVLTDKYIEEGRRADKRKFDSVVKQARLIGTFMKFTKHEKDWQALDKMRTRLQAFLDDKV